jgi:hypothetical protein
VSLWLSAPLPPARTVTYTDSNTTKTLLCLFGMTEHVVLRPLKPLMLDRRFIRQGEER